jgi:hypothetical protein
MRSTVYQNERGETCMPHAMFKHLKPGSMDKEINKPYPKKNRSIRKRHKARKGILR